MAKGRKKPIEQYEHLDKTRKNNPPAGLVTPDTDRDGEKKIYDYDPHLDPQLVWAGKAEHTSFEVPTVSLHVHERIDPHTIIEAVERRNGEGEMEQPALFETPEENPPLRQAIDFYQHEHSWSNRMIAGDSLLVMNSLLEKEGLAGQVQMIYIDPPYGIKYGSNFQPFINKRDVRDGRDADLTQEPEMIRAFRDTWELGIHSYLTYLRDRLLLSHELLSESGSVFVQISDENVHHVRELMDEVFGTDNYCGTIFFRTTTIQAGSLLPPTNDFLLWYCRNIQQVKFRQLYRSRHGLNWVNYDFLALPDGTYRKLTKDEKADASRLPLGARVYRRSPLTSPGRTETTSVPIEYQGKTYYPGSSGHWKTNMGGFKNLETASRVEAYGSTLSYRRYLDDFPYFPISDTWLDTAMGGYGESKVYVVQTNTKVLQRCILMATDPGDLIVDPTCGSGTTAYVAEQWGRRWITCDTSRVAITLAKQRLMTSLFDYYELAHPEEGVGSGFRYKTVPHIMLKSIANNPDIKEGMSREEIDAVIAKHAPQETLYDQPFVDKSKVRVTGPFTVEAVPAPTVRPLSDIDMEQPADESVARTGPTLRQEEWRDELLKTGIRGIRDKGEQMIRFSRVEPLSGTRYLHANAETEGDEPERVVVSFGSVDAPLEQRQVELAFEEAHSLMPRPSIIVFAAFQFDPEAARDIDALTKEKTGMTFLKAQMNTDLLTEDLKKKRSSNQSFWLIGQPDVELRRLKDGEEAGKWQVEVHGFDYYNTRTGNIESGDTTKIAMWMLDTEYDGRSIYPRQVFFPLADSKGGWSRLAKNLKVQIDEELIEAYRGTVSLPFEPGEHRRIAVKIVDDRGIESLKVTEVR